MEKTRTPGREELAKKVLDLGRAQILVNLRFLDQAVFALVPELSTKSRVATDGEKLFYDPGYVLSIYRTDPDNALRLWLHPLMHCLFAHMFVDFAVKREHWDLACDIAAEALIDGLNVIGKDDPLTRLKRQELASIKAQAGDLSAERVYHYLVYEETDHLEDWKRLFSFDDHRLWYSGSRTETGALSGRKPQREADLCSTGDEVQRKGQASREGRSIWKRIAEHMAAELESRSKEAGAKSCDFERELQKLRLERTDYRVFLRKFAARSEVLQVSDEEFDYIFYHYGMELYGDIPLIEPLEYSERERIRDLAIVIDTSGSVQGETVRLFLQKTYNILKQQESFDRRFILHLIQADADVKQDLLIRDQKEFDMAIETLGLKGFGGTDFCSAIDYIEKLKAQGAFRKLKGILYFTDGRGRYPERRPSFLTAFVFVDDGDARLAEVPPWAIRVLLNKRELKEL